MPSIELIEHLQLHGPKLYEELLELRTHISNLHIFEEPLSTDPAEGGIQGLLELITHTTPSGANTAATLRLDGNSNFKLPTADVYCTSPRLAEERDYVMFLVVHSPRNWERDDSPKGRWLLPINWPIWKDQVTLYPNWFPEEAPMPEYDVLLRMLRYKVYVLPVPFPNSFEAVVSFMYTQRTDLLLSSILPPRPPPTRHNISEGSTLTSLDFSDPDRPFAKGDYDTLPSEERNIAIWKIWCLNKNAEWIMLRSETFWRSLSFAWNVLQRSDRPTDPKGGPPRSRDTQGTRSSGRGFRMPIYMTELERGF